MIAVKTCIYNPTKKCKNSPSLKLINALVCFAAFIRFCCLMRFGFQNSHDVRY